MKIDFSNLDGREPLTEYPWCSEIDRLLGWLKDKPDDVCAFCFDVVMSLAYVDATSGIEKNLQHCQNAPEPYNAHLGFINLCTPCYHKEQKWVYQKAAKPQSGALGKLSCELILRFVLKLSMQLQKVIAVGGIESADAILVHDNGSVIIAEVKSAPLITYPIIFTASQEIVKKLSRHQTISPTTSQLRSWDSALYVHNGNFIPLGKAGDALWPFKSAVDFLLQERNRSALEQMLATWRAAREVYKTKDRNHPYYYLANASGNPPKVARERDLWPAKESISDSKTSAGMDRTDDIKKGIYQVLKIGTHFRHEANVKTALISNLPAYRHGDEYVSPFIDMLWGYESDITTIGSQEVLARTDLRRVFDYIITLEDPVLRDCTL